MSRSLKKYKVTDLCVLEFISSSSPSSWKCCLRRNMVFLSWSRPSQEKQKSCLARAGSFNYESKYKGATVGSASSLQKDNDLSEEGYLLNHARVLIGSGLGTYEKGKQVIQNWRHFQMNWTFVEPTTPIKNGTKFCVCVKEFLPWLMMPLEVVYVNENKNKNKNGGKVKSSFSFGSGTLQGHLLAGEERFSIELDNDNQVWYEILSISKPAHFLASLGYPYVQLRQKHFAKQSLNAVLKHVSTTE